MHAHPRRPAPRGPHTTPRATLNRRHLLLGTLGSLALAACGGGGDAAPAFRVPAETETQQAVLMASLGYDYKHDWSTLDTQARMIRELVAHVPVIYLVNTDQSDQPDGGDAGALTQALLGLGVPQSTIDARVRLLRVEHGEFWVRDYGGIFLSNGRGEHRVVDFEFDGYGYNAFGGPDTVDLYDFDNDLAVRVAESLRHPVERSPLIAEGGNLHFNGQGTVIALEIGLLGRNPGWSKTQIEDEIKRVFGVRKMLWLPRNLPTDAHAVRQTPYLVGGEHVYNLGVTHIDEMVAWVDARTLLLPEVTAAELAAAQAAGDPIGMLAHEVLEEAHTILRGASNEAGQPLDIVRVPEPGAILIDIGPDDVLYQAIADLDHHPVQRLVGAEAFAGNQPVKFVLPASYMNFLVTNGLVLIPQFHAEGRDPSLEEKDARFKSIIETCYPGRRVVQLNVDAILAGGGGMHCISQQVPV
ncbi:agmatine deiminase family protein [Piscinibacter sp.]|uniref:agmatine deiminase family protein n=1 Tax=Piscinibacter sp. TaxID=1903157 RepID=UPI0039E3B825